MSHAAQLSETTTQPTARKQLPPIVVAVAVVGLIEALDVFVTSMRFKREVAFLRLDHWARRHGW
jgi:hypothetical protein